MQVSTVVAEQNLDVVSCGTQGSALYPNLGRISNKRRPAGHRPHFQRHLLSILLVEASAMHTNWDSGEPSNSLGSNCVLMKPNSNWRWFVVPCNFGYFRSYSFICQYRKLTRTSFSVNPKKLTLFTMSDVCFRSSI